MPPKSKCIVCGKPALGRYCYGCAGQVLQATSDLYFTDREAWKAAVEKANREWDEQRNREE